MRLVKAHEESGDEPPKEIYQACQSADAELEALIGRASFRMQRAGLTVSMAVAVACHCLFGEPPVSLAFPLAGNGYTDPRQAWQPCVEVQAHLAAFERSH